MGNNGYDVDFDVMKVANWKREVQNELDSVDTLLRQVADVCSEIPGENDTFMNTLYDIGTGLSNAWTSLSKGFKSVGDALDNIVEEYKNKVTAKVDELNSFKSKIGL